MTPGFLKYIAKVTGTSFPSKVDTWLVAMPILGLAMAVCFGLWLSFAGRTGGVLLLAVVALPFPLCFLIALPCRYTLEDEHLLIRFGIFSQRIAYKDITGVALSASLRSAPALSLQRVRVSYGRSFQLVSPRDREWFIRALNEKVALAKAGPPVSAAG